MNRIPFVFVMGLLCQVLYCAPIQNSPIIDYLNNKHLALQQKMHANQVLLLYQIDANYCTISIQFLRKNKEECHNIPLPLDFKTKVTAFYQSLQEFSIVQKSKRAKFIQESHQLYQLLIKPFEQHLQKEEQLIIIGQGILQYLPFEVLLPNAINQPFESLDFLVKKHTISYFFHSDNFLQTAAVTASNSSQKFLGFAPVFQNKHPYSTPNTSKNRSFLSNPITNFLDNIPPLPYSEKEIKTIPQVLPISASLFLHHEAKKVTLKAKLQENFRYVHLATHSFADFKDKNNAGILCAGGLNECDPSYEILYAKDVEKLKIKADLVVLSSCQSGVGQLDSEGVQGIHRSFHKAGAQNVVFSLWNANDRTCHQFMTAFYTSIAQGNSYAQALRIAKLDLLKLADTASPNVWGTFLMIGK